MTIIGNNDTVSAGTTTDYSWQHTIQSLDSAVCPANAVLDSLNIRSVNVATGTSTIVLGIYDITSGANNAPLLYSNTVSVDETVAGVYSLTGLSVDFSAHSGKTLAIAHCKASSTFQGAANAATGNPRSAATTESLADPFIQNDTNGVRFYGLWAELTTAPSATITDIDSDNNVQVGQTGAIITTTGIDAASVTQSVTLGGETLTINSWS